MYQYRGRPVILFDKGGGKWSLRVEADPKRGLKDVGQKAVQERLRGLGIDTRMARTTVPVSRPTKAAARRKGHAQEVGKARAILARVDARRREAKQPPRQVDWYESADYINYCRLIQADASVARRALVAGVFDCQLPKRSK